MVRLHLLPHKNTNDSNFLLPIAVIDNKLKHQEVKYIENINVTWSNEKQFDIVDVNEFNTNTDNISYVAAKDITDTNSSVGLLIGYFLSEQDLNDWIDRVICSTPKTTISIGNNFKVKVYYLQNTYDNLIVNAFFVNNTVKNNVYYALFV